jgi:hypothetical protein
MHQTSSRLLRMTDDERPFTRVGPSLNSLSFVLCELLRLWARCVHKCTVIPTTAPRCVPGITALLHTLRDCTEHGLACIFSQS